jgi:hypothetical protein
MESEKGQGQWQSEDETQEGFKETSEGGERSRAKHRCRDGSATHHVVRGKVRRQGVVGQGRPGEDAPTVPVGREGSRRSDNDAHVFSREILGDLAGVSGSSITVSQITHHPALVGSEESHLHTGRHVPLEPDHRRHHIGLCNFDDQPSLSALDLFDHVDDFVARAVDGVAREESTEDGDFCGDGVFGV